MENSPQPAVPNPAPTPPPLPPAAPAPPSPYATHAEWRAWRRQQREYYRAQYGWGWFGLWRWFWAIALIVVGGYFLLVNLGLIASVNGDLVWPVLLIVLGVLVLVSRIRPSRA